jgi:U1 small nuclear ribonucleoprotein 70kDa
MRERDANYAIQKADGRKVDGKRILVDREMGRTSERWFPRRLGGGKGGESRRSDADYIVKEVQRELRREQQDLEDLKIREDMKASDQIKSEQAHHSGAEHNAAHPSAAEDDANEEREPGEL